MLDEGYGLNNALLQRGRGQGKCMESLGICECKCLDKARFYRFKSGAMITATRIYLQVNAAECILSMNIQILILNHAVLSPFVSLFLQIVQIRLFTHLRRQTADVARNTLVAFGRVPT